MRERLALLALLGAISSRPPAPSHSVPALLASTDSHARLPPLRAFELEGFAGLGNGVTGGGLPDPTDSTRYKVIDAATPDPALTLRDHLGSTAALVIELRTDVDLGALASQSREPIVNPELIRSGVGVVRVGSNKTLFSAIGATLRHGTLTIENARNVILRNLRFRGLWEWDDATRGRYDLQGWDFVALSGARNVWIDHCDFGKVYDGPVDIVRGSDLVTISWTRFSGDLEGEVARQIESLEERYQSNPADPHLRYYAALRQRQSVSEIVRHEIPQHKGTLVGNSDEAGRSDRGRLNLTLHHVAYLLVRQRMPRMRFGNAHVYNLFVDDEASAAGQGEQTAVNSTAGAAVLVENALFLEVKTPFAFSSGGRLAQRGSAWRREGKAKPFDASGLEPLDPDRLVWNRPSAFRWPDLRRVPYDYALDPPEYVRANLGFVGVIVPAGPSDEARLRTVLLTTDSRRR